MSASGSKNVGWAKLLLAAVVLAVSVGTPQAQDFPSRPVTMIVPFAAGGTTDVGLRALAAATEKHLGQRILIENRTGAGGVIGPMQMAAGAAPDGYTLSQIPIPPRPRSIRSPT